MMITEEEINWAIQIMEDPKAPKAHKWLANEIADAFLRQENRTLAWMHQCYLSRDVARMAEQRYGNRTNRAGTG